MGSRIRKLVIMGAAVAAVVGLSTPASAADSIGAAGSHVAGVPGSRDNTPGNREWAAGSRDNGPSSGGDHAAYLSQAKSLGLTSDEVGGLESQVHAEVARTGGAQVSLNEVRFDGGATVFALPGESFARPLTGDAAESPVASSSSHATHYRCPYFYFCAYDLPGYRGNMHMLVRCNFYYEVNYPVRSYVNNQTPGTAARFYDAWKDYWASSADAYYALVELDAGMAIRSIKAC